MNEELTKKLLDYLTNFEVFAKNELPEIAKQVLELGVYDSKVGLIFGSVMTLISIALVIFCCLKHEDTFIYEFFIPIIATIMFLTGLVLVPSSITTLKKIEIAPKVYLIDYARGKN